MLLVKFFRHLSRLRISIHPGYNYESLADYSVVGRTNRGRVSEVIGVMMMVVVVKEQKPRERPAASGIEGVNNSRVTVGCRMRTTGCPYKFKGTCGKVQIQRVWFIDIERGILSKGLLRGRYKFIGMGESLWDGCPPCLRLFQYYSTCSRTLVGISRGYRGLAFTMRSGEEINL